jgi:hypothetical protein
MDDDRNVVNNPDEGIMEEEGKTTKPRSLPYEKQTRGAAGRFDQLIR